MRNILKGDIFGERYKEYLKVPSPICGHHTTTGHLTTMDDFSIVGRGCGFVRATKESIYIRINNTTLNRNSGKYNHPHIWDRVLINTPGLQIKHQQEHPKHQQVHRTSLVPPRTFRSYIGTEINNTPQT